MSSRATASDPGFHPEASDRIEPYVWKIAGVVILGMIMSILDTTIVNVALHTLGRDLHSSISQIQWVVTGYLLALAAVIPITGWAARRFGAKRVYMTSLVLFTVGSALCAIATSTTELVLFRVLQGAGGGMIMPRRPADHGPGRRPQADGPRDGHRGDAGDARPILGPVVGGMILQNLHWSWIFLVNVPIGVIALHRRLARDPAHRIRRRPGAWTSPASRCSCRAPRRRSSTGSASSAATPASRPRPSSWPIAGRLGAAGDLLLARAARRAPAARHPPVREQVFAAASFTTFGLGAALFGAMILVPLYYQEVRHESLIATGLLVAPAGRWHAAVMPIAGRLTDRFGGGRVAIVGVSILCLGDAPAGVRRSEHLDPRDLASCSLVRGVGIGFSFMPAMTAAFASLRPEQLSDATPQMNVLQRIGGAIGTAVLAVVLQRAAGRLPRSNHLARAFDTAYWWSLGICVLSLIPVRGAAAGREPARAANARRGANAEAAVEPLGA